MGAAAWDLSPARVYWLTALREHDEEVARRRRVLDTAIAVSRAADLVMGGKESAASWKDWVADLMKED